MSLNTKKKEMMAEFSFILFHNVRVCLSAFIQNSATKLKLLKYGFLTL